jgi:hypothetical protein
MITRSGTANSLIALSKKTRRAYPPRSAEKIGLASTASRSGGLTLAKERLFSQPPRLDQAPEVIRERVEELLPDLEWKGRPSRGKKKADDPSPACYQNGLFLLEPGRRAIAKLPHCGSLHVITPVVTG